MNYGCNGRGWRVDRKRRIATERAGGSASPVLNTVRARDFVGGGRHAIIPDFSLCGRSSDCRVDRAVLSALRNTGRQQLPDQRHPAFYQDRTLAVVLPPVAEKGAPRASRGRCPGVPRSSRRPAPRQSPVPLPAPGRVVLRNPDLHQVQTDINRIFPAAFRGQRHDLFKDLTRQGMF